MSKFPEDVTRAEELTGGNSDILNDERLAPEEKVDYKELFATPKMQKDNKNFKKLKTSSYKNKVTPSGTNSSTPKFSVALSSKKYFRKYMIQDSKQPVGITVYTCPLCNLKFTRVGALYNHHIYSRYNCVKDTCKSVKSNSTFLKLDKNPVKRKSIANESSPIKKKLKVVPVKGIVVETTKKVIKVKTSVHKESKEKEKKKSEAMREQLLLDWNDDQEENDGDATDTGQESPESKPDEKPLENTNKASCFDFEDNDEDMNLDRSIRFGQKLPRVIPKEDKTKDGKSKDKGLTEDDSLELQFNNIMKETSVPVVPIVTDSFLSDSSALPGSSGKAEANLGSEAKDKTTNNHTAENGDHPSYGLETDYCKKSEDDNASLLRDLGCDSPADRNSLICEDLNNKLKSDADLLASLRSDSDSNSGPTDRNIDKLKKSSPDKCIVQASKKKIPSKRVKTGGTRNSENKLILSDEDDDEKKTPRKSRSRKRRSSSSRTAVGSAPDLDKEQHPPVKSEKASEISESKLNVISSLDRKDGPQKINSKNKSKNLDLQSVMSKDTSKFKSPNKSLLSLSEFQNQPVNKEEKSKSKTVDSSTCKVQNKYSPRKSSIKRSSIKNVADHTSTPSMDESVEKNIAKLMSGSSNSICGDSSSQSGQVKVERSKKTIKFDISDRKKSKTEKGLRKIIGKKNLKGNINFHNRSNKVDLLKNDHNSKNVDIKMKEARSSFHVNKKSLKDKIKSIVETASKNRNEMVKSYTQEQLKSDVPKKIAIKVATVSGLTSPKQKVDIKESKAKIFPDKKIIDSKKPPSKDMDSKSFSDDSNKKPVEKDKTEKRLIKVKPDCLSSINTGSSPSDKKVIASRFSKGDSSTKKSRYYDDPTIDLFKPDIIRPVKPISKNSNDSSVSCTPQIRSRDDVGSPTKLQSPVKNSVQPSQSKPDKETVHHKDTSQCKRPSDFLKGSSENRSASSKETRISDKTSPTKDKSVPADSKISRSHSKTPSLSKVEDDQKTRKDDNKSEKQRDTFKSEWHKESSKSPKSNSTSNKMSPSPKKRGNEDKCSGEINDANASKVDQESIGVISSDVKSSLISIIQSDNQNVGAQDCLDNADSVIPDNENISQSSRVADFPTSLDVPDKEDPYDAKIASDAVLLPESLLVAGPDDSKNGDCSSKDESSKIEKVSPINRASESFDIGYLQKQQNDLLPGLTSERSAVEDALVTIKMDDDLESKPIETEMITTSRDDTPFVNTSSHVSFKGNVETTCSSEKKEKYSHIKLERSTITATPAVDTLLSSVGIDDHKSGSPSVENASLILNSSNILKDTSNSVETVKMIEVSSHDTVTKLKRNETNSSMTSTGALCMDDTVKSASERISGKISNDMSSSIENLENESNNFKSNIPLEPVENAVLVKDNNSKTLDDIGDPTLGTEAPQHLNSTRKNLSDQLFSGLSDFTKKSVSDSGVDKPNILSESVKIDQHSLPCSENSISLVETTVATTENADNFIGVGQFSNDFVEETPDKSNFKVTGTEVSFESATFTSEKGKVPQKTFEDLISADKSSSSEQSEESMLSKNVSDCAFEEHQCLRKKSDFRSSSFSESDIPDFDSKLSVASEVVISTESDDKSQEDESNIYNFDDQIGPSSNLFGTAQFSSSEAKPKPSPFGDVKINLKTSAGTIDLSKEFPAKMISADFLTPDKIREIYNKTDSKVPAAVENVPSVIRPIVVPPQATLKGKMDDSQGLLAGPSSSATLHQGFSSQDVLNMELDINSMPIVIADEIAPSVSGSSTVSQNPLVLASTCVISPSTSSTPVLTSQPVIHNSKPDYYIKLVKPGSVRFKPDRNLRLINIPSAKSNKTPRFIVPPPIRPPNRIVQLVPHKKSQLGNLASKGLYVMTPGGKKRLILTSDRFSGLGNKVEQGISQRPLVVTVQNSEPGSASKSKGNLSGTVTSRTVQFVGSNIMKAVTNKPHGISSQLKVLPQLTFKDNKIMSFQKMPSSSETLQKKVRCKEASVKTGRTPSLTANRANPVKHSVGPNSSKEQPISLKPAEPVSHVISEADFNEASRLIVSTKATLDNLEAVTTEFKTVNRSPPKEDILAKALADTEVFQETEVSGDSLTVSGLIKRCLYESASSTVPGSTVDATTVGPPKETTADILAFDVNPNPFTSAGIAQPSMPLLSDETAPGRNANVTSGEMVMPLYEVDGTTQFIVAASTGTATKSIESSGVFSNISQLPSMSSGLSTDNVTETGIELSPSTTHLTADINLAEIELPPGHPPDTSVDTIPLPEPYHDISSIPLPLEPYKGNSPVTPTKQSEFCLNSSDKVHETFPSSSASDKSLASFFQSVGNS